MVAGADAGSQSAEYREVWEAMQGDVRHGSAGLGKKSQTSRLWKDHTRQRRAG